MINIQNIQRTKDDETRKQMTQLKKMGYRSETKIANISLQVFSILSNEGNEN